MPNIERKRLRENRIKDINFFKYKRNINLLDRPLFIPSRTSVPEEEYSDGTGYEIKCPKGLPVAYDIDVLNVLMHKAQIERKIELEFKPMRRLLQALDYTDGKANYDIVERSLDKWSRTKVSFAGQTFYTKGGHKISIRNLPILTYSTGKSQSVLIKIDDRFFEYNDQGFVQTFPLRMMTKLKPYSKRVFELLRKNDHNLGNLNPWKISFEKLMLKIPTLTETPNSKFLFGFRKSVEEINPLLPQYGIKCRYWVGRDTTNKDIVVVRKLPLKVRSPEDGVRIPIDEFRSWVNEMEHSVVDDETFFRSLEYYST